MGDRLRHIDLAGLGPRARTRSRPDRRSLRGLAIGGLSGAPLGLVVGIAEADDPGGSATGGESAALEVGLFGGTGAILGLAIGSAVRTESWRPPPPGQT